MARALGRPALEVTEIIMCVVAHEQLAGLRTCGHAGRFSSRHLMAVASRARLSDPVLMTAVVSAYRCGAVPVLHRIPSYDAPAWRAGRTDCVSHHTWTACSWPGGPVAVALPPGARIPIPGRSRAGCGADTLCTMVPTPPAGGPEEGLREGAAQPFTPGTLATERLVLLPLRVEHAEEMAAVLADPGLYAFTGGEPPSARFLRTRYRRLLAGAPGPGVSWCNWVVRLREDACLVGTVQATITAREDGLSAEVSWVVGTAWQGRGVATGAARALVDRLSGQSVREVVAHVHPEHRASAAVAAAAGLTNSGLWHDGELVWRLQLRC